MSMTAEQPLSVTHPELAMQAVGWDPAEITFGSHLKKLWRCEEGHEWEAVVKNRTIRRSRCPECFGRKLRPGVNDLATLEPKLAKEAHGWDPKTISRSSSLNLDWECSFGHIWNANVANRSGGAGCPVCTRKVTAVGVNDLKTEHPEIVEECDGWDPSQFLSGSNRRMKWVCELNHKWEATIYERATRGTGCPICSNQKTLTGFNDLKSTHPKIAAQAMGWDPQTVNGGSHARKEWKCELDHTWRAQIVNRTRAGQGCPYCSNRILLSGFNDLLTKFPDIAQEANGWEPSKILAGTHAERSWKCKFSHEWKATVDGRTSGKSGCPTCSLTGFDPNKEGWIYMMSHEDWGLLQIGISNNPEKRLSKHRSLGWELIDLKGPYQGDIAQGWENSILKLLSTKKVKYGHPKDRRMKKEENNSLNLNLGLESWVKSSYDVSSLKELMEQVQNEE